MLINGARHLQGTDEADALRLAIADVLRRLVEASPDVPDEMAVAAENVLDLRHIAYFIGAVVPLDVAARQQLLELDPVTAKLRRLVDLRGAAMLAPCRA